MYIACIHIRASNLGRSRADAIADFLRLDRALDCDRGRRLGCATFCCSLIVRLEPGERDPTMPDAFRKSCIDKDPDTGVCIHLDEDHRCCGIYADRPRLCQRYDCRTDPLLPVVLEHGFQSLMQLVSRAGQDQA
jgi:uncharacterized protein